MLAFILLCFLIPNVCPEKILIIGAGPAGIATVSRLLSQNISTDFRILEAENRIGGRIHSIPLGNAYVDLGAEYIHGEKGNLVYELVENLLHPKLGKNKDEVVFYYNGNKKTGENLWDEFFEIRNETSNDPQPNSSLGKEFIQKFNSKLGLKYENDTEMMNYVKNYLLTCECFVLSSEGAFSWSETSSTSNFVEAEGHQNLVWQGLGYKTIFEVLLKNFPNKTGYNIDDKISFNKTVTKIILEKGNTKNVRVKCEDGSEYLSEHVVFTPSLGVLKHDHKKLFQPNLNEEKTKIIENLGFDGVMKIIIEFPHVWWSENDFVFVWSDEEKEKLIHEIPFGPIGNDGRHWLSWFFTLGRVPNNPTILIGWIVGPLVPKIEKLTESEMEKGVMYAIRTFLGKDFNITKPVKVIHTKWCGNPHFRGTYSFETPEIEKLNVSSANSILSEPICDEKGIPRILFAGEATNPTRFSTVDGAIGTGFREADRLNKIIID